MNASEADRTPCHSSSSSRGGLVAVPCLLPNGHDGLHKGLGAVWSGGTTYPADLRDAHKRLEANLDGVTTDHAWTER